MRAVTAFLPPRRMTLEAAKTSASASLSCLRFPIGGSLIAHATSSNGASENSHVRCTID